MIKPPTEEQSTVDQKIVRKGSLLRFNLWNRYLELVLIVASESPALDKIGAEMMGLRGDEGGRR
jgi:hypothetical protein